MKTKTSSIVKPSTSKVVPTSAGQPLKPTATLTSSTTFISISTPVVPPRVPVVDAVLIPTHGCNGKDIEQICTQLLDHFKNDLDKLGTASGLIDMEITICIATYGQSCSQTDLEKSYESSQDIVTLEAVRIAESKNLTAEKKQAADKILSEKSDQPKRPSSKNVSDLIKSILFSDSAKIRPAVLFLFLTAILL